MAKTQPLDPRQRLLDAALKLFANRGYAGTAVQDVTDEAGVTKPTLYYHFGNKEGLFQALVDQAMDERLRLMKEAASPEKSTVEQLTDILVALTAFARRQPDLLRISFAVAFAAEGEYPTGFRKRSKINAAVDFVRQIIQAGIDRGLLNSDFDVAELTQAYFTVVQHSVALTSMEPKLRGLKPLVGLPPVMDPRRSMELFLRGASCGITRNGNGHHEKEGAMRRPNRTSKAVLVAGLIALSVFNSFAETTNSASASTNDTNQPPVAQVPSTNTSPANEPAPAAGPASVTNSVPVMPMPDVRPIPLAVSASHPELATVSPIARNAQMAKAVDLQTLFQLTAVRDDSLKISMEDIEIARAQLSEAISQLWPQFSASTSQQFLHYLGPSNGLSFTSFGVPVGGGTGSSGSGNTGTGGTGTGGTGTGGTGTGGTGTSAGSTITAATGNRNYESQSNVTMSYTIFNGGQNWNNVGASARAVASKKQTLARNYETIYQDVAQAFYNALQYEGDMNVEADLIDALHARVTDLQDRVKLGRSRPSELLQAQTDLANAKVTYESQRGSLNAAKETVAFYSGVPSAYLQLKDTQPFPSAEQLDSYIMHSPTRPDVLAQVETMKQAERNLSVAEGQLFPTVSAQGNYLAQQDPVSNNIDATMTIQVSMPIFDGGLIISQIHQNHEMVRQARLDIEQLQRTADQDTRTAYANFDAAVAQVVVLREAASLAAKDFEAQVDDYRRGVVSNLDVLTALQDYQTARIQLHNANMQARLNLINLNVASGLAARGPGANNQALPIGTTRVAQ